MPSVPVRERLLEAAYACVARYGLAKTTMDDVAREAGMSRATVYRYFPGGRDELVSEVVAWETARFFTRLADAIAGTEGFAHLLEEALVFAHRAVVEHEVLQKILQTEPDRLLPQLTVQTDRLIRVIGAFLLPELQRVGVREGVDPGRAAEHIARLFLSYIGSPGSWDLDDPDQVRDLVRRELLAGIV